MYWSLCLKFRFISNPTIQKFLFMLCLVCFCFCFGDMYFIYLFLFQLDHSCKATDGELYWQPVTCDVILVSVKWRVVMPACRLSEPNLNNPGITPVFVWLFTLGEVSSLCDSNTSHYCRPSVDTGQCWPPALQTAPFTGNQSDQWQQKHGQ